MSAVRDVVNAVLYEGYMLYPYRASSVKNRQRWTFGGVCPQTYSVARGGSDPYVLQTECLVEGTLESQLDVSVEFLHLVQRQVGELSFPLSVWQDAHDPAYRKVEATQVGDKCYYTWQEATERRVALGSSTLEALKSLDLPFEFAGDREIEPLYSCEGSIPAMLVRTRAPLQGRVRTTVTPVGDGVFCIRTRVMNTTAMKSTDVNREEAMLQSLVSCHTIFTVRGGQFISLLDPPDSWQMLAAKCENVGTWPVLVGAEGSRDTLLSSPIILYDYPQIAQESPGDLFDATEIDEILTLRILTMTDREKREMAAVDERSRRLLERTESLTSDQLQKLHGTLRGMRPVTPFQVAPWEELDNKPRLAYLRVSGVELRIGDRVRLKPRGRADIFDLALAGKVAMIESLERDFEDKVHVAVSVDDDPGRDLGTARMPGHRFFFSPDEIEPIANEGRQ